MPTPLAAIETQVQLLSPEERELEEAWAAEIGRRIVEVEAGRMSISPIEAAIARARTACSSAANRFQTDNPPA